MKLLALIIIGSLLSISVIGVSSSSSINWVSKNQADEIYCQQNGVCVLDSLNVTGEYTYINSTIIEMNSTTINGNLSVNDTLFVDIIETLTPTLNLRLIPSTTENVTLFDTGNLGSDIDGKRLKVFRIQEKGTPVDMYVDRFDRGVLRKDDDDFLLMAGGTVGLAPAGQTQGAVVSIVGGQLYFKALNNKFGLGWDRTAGNKNESIIFFGENDDGTTEYATMGGTTPTANVTIHVPTVLEDDMIFLGGKSVRFRNPDLNISGSTPNVLDISSPAIINLDTYVVKIAQSGLIVDSASLVTTSALDIVPNIDGGLSFGSTVKQWGVIYTVIMEINDGLNVGGGATIGTNLEIGGDILPDIDVVSDLGSGAKRWQSLYVADIQAQDIVIDGMLNGSWNESSLYGKLNEINSWTAEQRHTKNIQMNAVNAYLTGVNGVGAAYILIDDGGANLEVFSANTMDFTTWGTVTFTGTSMTFDGSSAYFLADTISMGRATGADIKTKYDTSSNDGLLTWKTDERYFEYNNSVDVLGNITGNQLYGEMWNRTPSASPFTVTISTVGIYYNISGLVEGATNGFNFTDETQANGGSFIIPAVSGKYQATASLSPVVGTASGDIYGFAISHAFSRENHNNCYARRVAQNKLGNVGITCIMDITAGIPVNLQVEQESGGVARDIAFSTVNLNLVRIGD